MTLDDNFKKKNLGKSKINEVKRDRDLVSISTVIKYVYRARGGWRDQGSRFIFFRTSGVLILRNHHGND